MKNRWKFVFLSIYILLFPGCDNPEFKTGIIRIQLEKPAGYEDVSLDSIPITLTNQSQGTTFTILSDTVGQAEFMLTAGICQITIHKEITQGNTDFIASGGSSEIRFPGEGETQVLHIPLEISTRGRLLIEELYFGGCLQPDGKSTYIKDPYIILANNSEQVIYLDGYCLAQAAPSTTAKPSKWMLYTDMQEIPLYLMCWEFPGTGNEYPIQPGERQVIALNATDHTSGDKGIPASIDLSNAKWAFWNSSFTNGEISAGAIPLNLLWKSSGTGYMFTVNGPTFLLFHPEGDIREWISDPLHIRTEPNSTASMRFLHIPTAWVHDAVNFVSSISTTTHTRIPITLDSAPGIAAPVGSGKAWRRKRIQENERSRWVDTNNTFADFEEITPSLK